jgi:hypothetical protein
MIIGIHHSNLRYIFHITTLFNFFYFEVISKRVLIIFAPEQRFFFILAETYTLAYQLFLIFYIF